MLTRKKLALMKGKSAGPATVSEPPMDQASSSTGCEDEAVAPASQQTPSTDELNPLKNDAILKAFFGVCSVAQLKTFRLVCKQWHKISLDDWRESAVLRVENRKTFVKDFNELKESLELNRKPFHRLRVCPYVYDILNSRSAALTIFRGLPGLENVTHLEVRNSLTPNLFHEIIFELTPNLVSLKLTDADCTLPSGDNEDDDEDEDTLDSVNELLPAYPMTHASLRRLEFSRELPDDPSKWGNYDDGERIDHFAFLIWLFKRAPNLDYVSLRLREITSYREEDSYGIGYQGPDEYEGTTQFLGLLMRAEVDRSLIKKLDLYDLCVPYRAMDYRFLKALHKAQLPLQVLMIDVDGEASGDTIKSLLKPYTETLRKLQVNRYPDRVQLPRTMEPEDDPLVIPNLEELVFGERLNDTFYFLSLCVTPKLKKLVLEDPSRKKRWNSDESATFTWERVEPFWVQMAASLATVEILDLNLVLPMRVFTAQDIEVLGEAMPGLRELSLPTGKPGFGAICKIWKNLRILKIYGGVQLHPDAEPVDDGAITGKWKGMDRKIHGCIKDLTELTDFTMEHQGIKKKYVTDVAVINGFLLTPNLRFLSIQFDFVSARGREALEAKGMILEDQKAFKRNLIRWFSHD